ncbi:uncharacterized protein [Vicugna pacos]|uniref:Uncharacterized protein n=1 Tax=Vicugna pacos TaxID=30538 RepID=A0ABM5CGJ9_VICPA
MPLVGDGLLWHRESARSQELKPAVSSSVPDGAARPLPRARDRRACRRREGSSERGITAAADTRLGRVCCPGAARRAQTRSASHARLGPRRCPRRSALPASPARSSARRPRCAHLPPERVRARPAAPSPRGPGPRSRPPPPSAEEEEEEESHVSRDVGALRGQAGGGERRCAGRSQAAGVPSLFWRLPELTAEQKKEQTAFQNDQRTCSLTLVQAAAIWQRCTAELSSVPAADVSGVSPAAFRRQRNDRCPCKSEIHTPDEQTLKGQRTRLPGGAAVFKFSDVSQYGLELTWFRPQRTRPLPFSLKQPVS